MGHYLTHDAASNKVHNKQGPGSPTLDEARARAPCPRAGHGVVHKAEAVPPLRRLVWLGQPHCQNDKRRAPDACSRLVVCVDPHHRARRATLCVPQQAHHVATMLVTRGQHVLTEQRSPSVTLTFFLEGVGFAKPGNCALGPLRHCREKLQSSVRGTPTRGSAPHGVAPCRVLTVADPWIHDMMTDAPRPRCRAFGIRKLAAVGAAADARAKQLLALRRLQSACASCGAAAEGKCECHELPTTLPGCVT